MPRKFAPLIALLLAVIAGCDDSDTASPPPQAQAAPAPAVDPAAAAGVAAAPVPAAAGPEGAAPGAQVPGQPAPMPVATAQPQPGPQQPIPGQQPVAGQPGGPGYPNQPLPAGAQPPAVFVPFPPFVIAAAPKTPGGLAGVNPALPAGQPFQGGPIGQGLQPPGVNIPGGVARAERKPQTEIESYEGTELFAIAPNGALAATFAIDSSKRPVVYELKLWNLTTGKSVATLESSDNLRSMAISPNGKLLATVAGSGENSELTLWELPAGTKQSSHNWSKYGNVSFSSDSGSIVAAAGRKGIAILDLATGKVKPKPLKNLARTLTVQASPVEPIVAIGLGAEKRPEEKAAGGGGRPGANATPKELAELRKKHDQQQQAAQAGAKKKRRKGDKNANNNTAQDPNEALGLEPGAEGLVEILDLDTLKIRKKLYVTGAPADLAFNATGTVLAALMVGGQGEMWDTATWIEQGGKLGRTAGGPAGFVQPQPGAKAEKSASIESNLLVLSPDADWAAARQTSSSRSPADIWDTRTGQARPIDTAAVSQLGFLPDGTLVWAGRDKALRFFELPAITPVYPPFAKR